MSNKLPRFEINKELLNWSKPSKKIYGSNDVLTFHKSIAIDRIQTTLYLICEKVSLCNVPNGILDDKLVEFEETKKRGGGGSGGGNSQLLDLPGPKFDISNHTLNEQVLKVLNLIESLFELVNETPAYIGPRRFGNMAFREWHDKLNDKIDKLFEIQYKDNFNNLKQFNGFIIECKYYFISSFGSRERLDYGTGHELSFLSFISSLLMCGDLLQIDKLNGVDYLIIFSKYYDLIKTLILTYNLEPAGSHGVWGLDDHFHLIYILGASQLVKFNELKVKTDINPNSVFNTSILKNMRSKNLFFNAISFIKKVKKGPFSEHSPMLYDILTTKTWDKITKGMIKMYYGEILSKYPVVQHFYFGNVLFPWIDKVTLKQLPESTPDDEEEEEIDKSEAEIAMHQIYHNRERELIKLANQRGMNKPSTTRLKKGSDITNTKAPWSV